MQWCISMRSTLPLCDSSTFHIWSRKLYMASVYWNNWQKFHSKGKWSLKQELETVLCILIIFWMLNDSALLYRMEDLSTNVNLSIFLQVKTETDIFRPLPYRHDEEYDVQWDTTQSPLDRQVGASWYTNIFYSKTSQIMCGFPVVVTT